MVCLLSNNQIIRCQIKSFKPRLFTVVSSVAVLRLFVVCFMGVFFFFFFFCFFFFFFFFFFFLVCLFLGEGVIICFSSYSFWVPWTDCDLRL